MDPSIFKSAMSAANAGFRNHTLEEVKAAANNACRMAEPFAAQLAGHKDAVLQERAEGVSLAGSVAAMDASERRAAAPVREAVPETDAPSFEAEQQEPDIGM